MEYKLLDGAIIASQDKNGTWIYKANTENQLKPFKKNGTLKAVYKDLPRFTAISQYEEVLNKEYQKTVIEESIKQIITKLLAFT